MDIDQPEVGSAPKRRGRPPRMTPVEAKSEPVSVVKPTIARASIRTEVRTRNRSSNNTIDEFNIPRHLYPDGTDLEWKMESVTGKEFPQYQVKMHEQGWRPVDASVIPELVPHGYKGAIRRDGLVLMERPMELTLEARAEAYQNAQREVRIKEAQLRGSTGPFNEDRPGTGLKVSRTIVPGAIPE